jgi:hypothetical protein
MQVWDLSSGQCVQTLEKAHSGTSHPAIRGLLVWEGHLVSSSLDGLIKVRSQHGNGWWFVRRSVETFVGEEGCW